MLKIKDIAEKEIKFTLAQLCIEWVIANKDASTCILGVAKTSQHEENLKAFEIFKEIGNEAWIEIEKILDKVPAGEREFIKNEMLPSRRNIVMGIDFKK